MGHPIIQEQTRLHDRVSLTQHLLLTLHTCDYSQSPYRSVRKHPVHIVSPSSNQHPLFCSPPVSFFWIAKLRSSKVLEEILGETYGGTVVSDFSNACIKYANKLQQFCLAHLTRDIEFLTTLPDQKDQAFGNALLV
ncbi:MAG: transposase [Phycisphaerales bacterium]|nr:MAG: transposase [Phycisphaerales bacterium]